VELLPLAMSRTGEVMEAEVVRFGGIHVFFVLVCSRLCSSRLRLPFAEKALA
jgi:hypothetical protein